MEHLESNQEARYMAEEASNRITEIGDQLDPEGEQDIEDCIEEELQLHPDYEHMATNEALTNEKSKHEKAYRAIEVDSMDELLVKTRELDFYQRAAVEKGINFARNVVTVKK